MKSSPKVASPNSHPIEDLGPYLSTNHRLSNDSTLSEDAGEPTNPLLFSRLGTQAGDSEENALVKVHPFLSLEELE
jgi:hypothetical protein